MAYKYDEDDKRYHRQYYLDHREEMIKKATVNNRKNRVKRAKQAKARYYEKRLKVLLHYGNGKIACIKCGFSDTRALSIDHIHGGGLQHRRHVIKGYTLALWLWKHGLPEGYQTLCMNCQFIKERV